MRCPVCGEPLEMNLRCDSTFAEDKGWHEAAEHYHEFLQSCSDRPTLFLELGTVVQSKPTSSDKELLVYCRNHI